jgi:uncharacterized membrane protein SpoIIM required for sporulation
VYGIILGVFILGALLKQASGDKLDIWWFPLIITLIALEYFIYDDQFTLIALIILPMIIAIPYNIIFKPKLGKESSYTPTYLDEEMLLSEGSTKPTSREEDILITYIRFSLMAVAIAEVLSTALWVAGIGTVIALGAFGQNIYVYLAGILPHAIIEIPAFLFAAAASIRIARDLAPSVQKEDWSSITSKTKSLITDARTWRTYVLVLFFLLIGALIEANVTPIIRIMVEIMMG